MKKFNPIEAVVVCLIVLATYALMGGYDAEDTLAAEEHAKHAMQLAQQEEDERKAEFNYLAAKATRMTGFAAVTGK